MSEEILAQQAEPALEETAVEPAAQTIPKESAKPVRKVKKRWHPVVRFFMGLIGFVLCIVMFVTALTGILLLDLRAMTSENGISTIIQTLLTSSSKPAPVLPRPGLAPGGFLSKRAADKTEGDTTVEVDENGQLIVNGQVVGTVGTGSDTTGDTSTETPDSGSESNDLVVDWVIGQLQQFTGGELPVTPEQIEHFVEESTIKDFIAEKVSGMVGDFYSGNITTTITIEEITQLMEENKALIQSEFGIEITEEHTEALKQLVEDTGILEQVQEQGIMGILGSMGGNGGEEGGIAGPGMSEQMQTIQRAVELVRQITSYDAIAAVWVIFLALAAILFCTTQFSWPATLADCGIVLMLASSILVIPSVICINSPDLVISLVGDATVLKVAQMFFSATAGVNYGIFGAGIGLIVLAIVAACIRAAMRKKAA